MGRISVTPAEEDEVIIAGTVSSEEREPELAPEPELATGPEPIAPAQPGTSRRQDDYPEMTLEDLEAPSMPLAQRIVIIAAVVCIIGAIVLYFAVMR